MLTRVRIENYRGFRTYDLEKMTAVNLLVGRNNSGKTALLESVHILASGGDPMVLVNAASRRGEVVSGGREEPLFLDISHFFHGHEVGAGSYFSLATENGFAAITAKIVPLEEVEAQRTLFDDARGVRPAFALKIEGGVPDARGERYFVLSEDGAWLVDQRRALRRYFSDERREGPPIVFISPDSVEPDSLGMMWNQVLRDKQEAGVRTAMQILESGLEDIVFQTGDAVYRPFSRSFGGRSGVLVSFSGSKRRVPLGSMGDGMRRLLALSISLIHARDGFLIIDEIDTGLHYSIMAKMWELVVRTARDSNIQVFATTHSADCVKGLGLLCKRSPDLQTEVSVHKVERDLKTDVTFTGAEVLNAVEQDIEIR
ncbi:ATP/GTP phosphatase [Phycisphaerae bacterium RAS1]|nr:ATP/GTP phosphatase [Phycisphaerae bacterium RAS1]